VSTSRTNKLSFWIALLGVVGVIWAVLPLLQGSDPTPEAPSTPTAVDNTWVPEPAGDPTSETSPPVVEEPTADTTAPTSDATSTTGAAADEDHGSEGGPVVHSEEEPADQPTLAAVPPDTPSETLEELAEAVEARLVADLTGTGRDVYEGVVWRNEPCCASVTITGLVADFSNPQLVRVIVEWETDLGKGSGPTYWKPDLSGSWSLAAAEPSL
jgi:hypothetical protein